MRPCSRATGIPGGGRERSPAADLRVSGESDPKGEHAFRGVAGSERDCRFRIGSATLSTARSVLVIARTACVSPS